MRGGIKADLAAAILVEAAYTTDDRVCAKYGISIRTIQRHRRRLANDLDPELATAVAAKKAAFDAAWADSLPIALRAGIDAIAEISRTVRDDKMMHRNPAWLERLAGAVKLTADVFYTGKIIDARIQASKDAGTPRQDNKTDSIFGEDAAGAGDSDFVS